MMGGRDGKDMSPEEREDNAVAQTEEMEALEAIYGDSCCGIQRSAVAAPEVVEYSSSVPCSK